MNMIKSNKLVKMGVVLAKLVNHPKFVSLRRFDSVWAEGHEVFIINESMGLVVKTSALISSERRSYRECLFVLGSSDMSLVAALQRVCDDVVCVLVGPDAKDVCALPWKHVHRLVEVMKGKMGSALPEVALVLKSESNKTYTVNIRVVGEKQDLGPDLPSSKQLFPDLAFE